MTPDPTTLLTPSLTDTLCTRCGLCCDGTLFADVELGRADAMRLESLGLDVEVSDGGLLSQPCAALKGRRCSIYAHRPSCCRTFECQLLQEAQRGEVTADRAAELIEVAQRQIQRVRDLLALLGERRVRLPLKERCAAALSGGGGSGPAADRNREALEVAMRALDRMLERTFLGAERRGDPPRGGRSR